MIGFCGMCGCKLSSPKRGEHFVPWFDCGGDCLVCMASVGDPDCIAALRKWLKLVERA